MKNFWKNKKVVITGSRGFVGYNLLKELQKRKANIIEIPFANNGFPNFDDSYVFHLGAKAIVGDVKENPKEAFDANIKGTYDLLEACRLSNPKKVIIASTDKVYGEGLNKNEYHNLNGLYPYDVSKHCADKLAQCYWKSYNMPIAITRFVNIYGEGDKHLSRIIPYIISQTLKNKPIEIRSDGKSIRDFIYIKDVINGYLKLAESKQNGVFNFGTNSQIEVIALVKTILKLTKSRSKIKILNIAKNEIREQSVNSLKSRILLNWYPKYSLEQGLKQTIKWWKKK